jgi:hypothetical protein
MMKKHSLGIALLCSVATACSDGPVRPDAPASLSISGAASGATRLTVGQTVQLQATLRNGAGNPLVGAAVTWTSSDHAVAQVTSGGQVTAVAAGSAKVVAASGLLADTVRIEVLGAALGADCGPGSQSVSLAVGQTRTLDATSAATVCVGGHDAGAEYAVIPFHGSSVASAQASFEVTASRLAPPAAVPAQAMSLSTPLFYASDLHRHTHDESFHIRLREREARELTPERVQAARAALRDRELLSLNRSGTGSAVPQEGSLLPLNVSTSCSRSDLRTGRVAAVTQRAIVVVDTANPRTGITDAEYRSFGITFDTLVHPLLTATFGEVQDVDANGRTVIFYTRAVNELTREGSSGYVGGFFWAGDLFPKTGQNGCANGNYAEMFYMLAPDPSGEVNGNVRGDELIRSTTISIIAHEFQHLINASRRMYVNDASGWEESWLNEGLSHIAEELLFYRASGLQPRQKITIEAVRSSPAVLSAFNQHQLSNYARFMLYLRSAGGSHSLIGANSPLETRGAIWAFLRYAADRRNGDDHRLWFDLANSRSRGMDNLRGALGTDPLPWIEDWSTSLFAGDFVPGLDGRFATASWNHRSITSAFRDSGGQYPLRVQLLRNDERATFALAGSGAAYLRLEVPAGQHAVLRTGAQGGGSASHQMRFTFVRVR